MSISSIQAGQAAYNPYTTQQNQEKTETTSVTQAGTTDTVSFSPKALEFMRLRSVTDQERTAFKDILNRAAAAEAYDNPKQFLKSLSSSEMELLRKTHSLASPIKIDPLSFEGAYNLLRPPSEAEDLNNDGGPTAGIGTVWEFPPPNATEAVKKSWEISTSGLNEGDKATVESGFLFSARFKNMVFEDGQFVKEIQPGDPGHRNIFSEEDFSYQDMTQHLLNALEVNKKNMSREMYEMQKRCLETFKTQLAEHGVI